MELDAREPDGHAEVHHGVLVHLVLAGGRPHQANMAGDVCPSARSSRGLHGRLVFATHRDLVAQSSEGKFREDLYERINGLRIHMPSLRQMIAEAPGEMRVYVRWFVAGTID